MTLIQDLEEDLATTKNSTNSVFHCIQLSMSKSKKRICTSFQFLNHAFYTLDISIARPVIMYLKFPALCKE